MPTNTELIFWIVCAILAILFIASMPIISNFLENKEVERMFDRPDINIDDMEDR